MNRVVALSSLLLGLLGPTAACSDSGTSPTTVTTETFTGTLAEGAQNSFPFTTAGSGTVTVTATSLSPQLTVGLGIGTLNGSACTAATQNATAQQASVVTMSVSSAATYCALVYDPGGLASSVAYTITVAHP